MDILEELEYYCETDIPVGALMLSGEWGCGKTYLIKKKFVDAVKDKYAVLCISLFGLESIEAVKQEVKKQWLEKAGEIIPQDGGHILSKAAEGYKKLFGTIKGILPEDWQERGEAVSSIIDLVNYIPVTNTMYEKKVILVFDDLERSNIPGADILGCINDYCENQHFHVIIVANEDKIKKTTNEAGGDGEGKTGNTTLSYDEIKEKIVQRVIPFAPDYAEVVDNSIEWLADGIEYKGFLRGNKETLVRILSGDFDDDATLAQFKKDKYRFYSNSDEYNKEERKLRELLKQRQHNIRSLKCAIQDFKRVYDLLRQVGIDECDRWLIAFTCYMMTYKAGLISDMLDSDYFDSNKTVRELYPDIFNSSCMVNSIACWIIKGDWNQANIEEELRYVLRRKEAESPVDILRTNLLIDVEDEIIKPGFSSLLELAYNGSLTLDEYIVFIQNSCYARMYEVDIPEIDWKKVKEGIRSQFEQMLSPEYVDTHVHNMIDPENKEYYTKDEWSTYQLISDFRNQGRLTYGKNSRLYIDLLSNDLRQAFEQLSMKKYDGLTSEMEDATYNAYKKAQNTYKKLFPGWFSRIWINYRTLQDTNVQMTEESLIKLKEDLKTLKDDYKEKGKKLAEGHTQSFIKEIDKIIAADAPESE